MTLEKSLYSLAEAAELAKFKPSDLLHYAVQNRKFTLLIGVPDWVEVRAYDEETNTDYEPFLLVPQLLVLKQSYCLKIEVNGRTQQNDFSTGYFVESSGKLKKIRPGYGYRELNPDFLCWRTYRDKLVNLLELVPENLFVLHSDLAQFLEPAVKPKDSESASSRPRKPTKAEQNDLSRRMELVKVETQKQAPDPDYRTADSNHRDLPQKAISKLIIPTYQDMGLSKRSPEADAFVRLKKLQVRTGMSRSTIYNKLNTKSKYYDPTFPKQIQIGADSVGWLESEVQKWIESRISVSRSKVSAQPPHL